MAEVSIRPTKNGPLIVKGPVELFDTNGNKVTVDKPRIALLPLWRFIKQTFL